MHDTANAVMVEISTLFMSNQFQQTYDLISNSWHLPWTESDQDILVELSELCEEMLIIHKELRSKILNRLLAKNPIANINLN